MTLARYVFGLAALGTAGAFVVWGSWRLRRALLPDWSGALARLAEAVIALAEVIAVEEVLGVVGRLRLGARVVAVAAAGLGVGVLAGRNGQLGRSPSPSGSPGRRVGEGGRAMPAVAGTVSALVVSQWAARALYVLRHGMDNVDSLWFHLPFAARAMQSGWLIQPHFTDVDPLTTYFPATPELLHGMGMLAFGRDNLSPLLNVAWLGLVMLAAWCVGRPSGMAAYSLTGVAVVLATPLMVVSQPGQATNDTAGIFFLLAAVAFLLNGASTVPASALAGLAGGLAVGCKLSLLAPVAALTIAAIGVAPRGRRRSAGVAWTLPLVLAGSYWYARNLAVSGSPLPWFRLGIGRLRLASPSFPVTRPLRYSILHYAGDRRACDRFFHPGLVHDLGTAWAAVLLDPLGGLLVLAVPAHHPLARASAIVGVLAAVAYVVTPNGAGGPQGQPFLFLYNMRYLTPALAIGFALVPSVSLRWPASRPVVAGALVALLGATETGAGPLPAWPAGRRAQDVAAAAGVAVLSGLLVLASRRPVPWLQWRIVRRAALLGGVALALPLGWWEQSAWAGARYDRAPPAYAWARHVSDARIAVAGSYIQYPLDGQDLSNRVQFVGVRLPHGGFRAAQSCAEWWHELIRGRYRYVVVVPRQSVQPEMAWTGADPGARIIAGDGQSAVFRIDGGLTQAPCRR